MPTRQARHWCFTLNNYGDVDVQRLRDLSVDERVDYVVFGREKGEKGTPHLQGYIAYAKKASFGKVKEDLGSASHLEPARGSPKQASEYCKKDQDFEEFGVLPRGQGSRSDLIEVHVAVKNGASLRTLAQDYPTIILRYGSGVQRLRSYYRPERETAPEIHVFWGPTGSGKTRRVWEFADKQELWVHPGDRWFDGYDGHRSVLFDDFDGSWFKLHYLLKLLDRYVMPVPVKGGYTWWVPQHIFITSNIDPKLWYDHALEDHKRALRRRLSEFGNIVHCG
jgi:hypothetical protein